MIKIKSQKGITLLALVITVIVLLILASVAMGQISSGDGIINHAENMKNSVEEGVKHKHILVTEYAKAPTCTEKGLTVGKYCEVCGEVIEKQTEEPALGHDYITTTEVAATCTEGGTIIKECSRCKYTITETVLALGHKEVTDVAVAATCTTPGKTEGKHCEVCGEVIEKQTEVAALGHSMKVGGTFNSTCTTKGRKVYVCNRGCGYSYGEELPLADHSWGPEDWTERATCTTKGYGSKTCTVCYAMTTITEDALRT